jgi:hypothetical protein
MLDMKEPMDRVLIVAEIDGLPGHGARRFTDSLGDPTPVELAYRRILDREGICINARTSF